MVDHEILIKKLTFYGIRGTPLEWFKSYLHGRRQIVKLDKVLSDPLPIDYGVPQGSILGPLLFLIFINDLCDMPLKMSPLLFADDTTLLLCGPNVDEFVPIVNQDLRTLSNWFNANKLLININKTQFMFFSLNRTLHNSTFNIVIDNSPIERVHQTKFLGVVIDSGLTWTDHVSRIANKMSRNIGIINKVKNLIDEKSLIQLYNTLVLPYLMYCHLIWGKCSQTNLNRLIRLQKKL